MAESAPAKIDVVTFGETMIRLNPPGMARLEQAKSLDLHIGGSESNVACALAQIGRGVSWWSRLPDSPLGRMIAGEVRRWGVDTRGVRFVPGSRAGLYFVESGPSPRGVEVVYDRAGSAASTLCPDDIDRDLLRSARHLHLTGITAALSDTCRDTIAAAASLARESGVTVSLDVNYRRKLWQSSEARDALLPVMPFVDLLVCTAADAREVFGVSSAGIEIARELQQRLGVPRAAVTLGADGAVAMEGERAFAAASAPAVVIDRVGAGDAFDAGLIDGFLDGDLERGLVWGWTMACLKHTVPGDILPTSRAEVASAVAGAAAGIRR